MKISGKKLVAIVISIAIFSYLAYVYFSPPVEGGMHIKCMTKTIFNINCMSCGLTRFVYYAMHGDFAAAMTYNILGPLLLVILALIYFFSMRWALFDKPYPNIPVWAIWVFFAFVVVYSILRNIPYEPLKFLAPPS